MERSPTATSPAAISSSAVFRPPRLRGRSAADWIQLVRFCAVGASGYIVNLVVFAALLNWAGAHYIVAAVGAFCIAWLNNFALNRQWTFRDSALSVMAQGIRYLSVSLFALGINLALLHLLVVMGVTELFAQAVAVLLVTPVAFLLNRRWAFR